MALVQIALPTGSYVNADPRSSTKRLVNVFSEINPQTARADEKQIRPPITLRRWAGTSSFTTDSTTNAVRGMWQMQGIFYAVIGPTLYSISSAGTLTNLGTGISGTSFVRMSDNTACLFILIPNSKIAYTYCPNATPSFAIFTNSTFIFYGAIDVWFVDSYFIFLALNGRSFYNDDGQIVSGQGPPTFVSGAVFPREFGTDPFVGMAIDHREVVVFGQHTSEGYVNAGNSTFSPFAAAPDGFMQIGMHPDAAYSAALQDQSVFWVASDRTVRRRSGQTPQRVSNSGIEAILEHANLVGSYALTPSIAGHPLWVYTMPNESGGRTIVYDCLTTEWFELQSYNIGYWRILSYINILGKQYVGDSLNGQIGILDTNVFTEFGQPLVSTFTTQSVYDRHNRISHRRVELVMTPGASTSLLINPQVTLYRSDDSGQTFLALPLRGLGTLGQRKTRTTWFNLGQSRDRVYRFQISDPTPTFSVDVTADLEPATW